jgi:glycosyltransferase involved in cell wall biosynthesis
MKARAEQGVLFVSHDATRTGAPMVLLHFLRWFKRNGNRPFAVLLGSGGPLVSEFEQLGPTWSVDWSRWRPGSLRTQLASKTRIGGWAARRAEAAGVRDFAKKISPALVYTNSIGSARVIDVLGPEYPVLTHLHELESYFQKLASPALERLLQRTRQFIACSNAVRENLLRRHGAREEQIETIHESIPVSEIRATRGHREIMQELGFPGDAQVVVGVGTPSWRKGTDLFVQLARTVCRQHNRAHFVWVGNGPTMEFEHDVRASGLAEKVRFTGERLNPPDYVAAADIFALTSREDPYPLACLEAAALGKPIICFADAGGVPEFVEQDAGYVVPYLDVAAMAERIVDLLDCAERFTMGAAARRKVGERHDISRAAPRILELIERTIAKHSSVGQRL